MIKLLNLLNEWKIHQRIHNLDLSGVKFEDIQVGDILMFTVGGPVIETVRQKVILLNNSYGGIGLTSQDLNSKGELVPNAKDYWVEDAIENYWKETPASLSEVTITRKQIIGSGIQHDVYPFEKDPTKVIKVSAYGKGINKDYVELFKKYPTVTAKFFKAPEDNSYMVVERLDTEKFIEENRKFQNFLSKPGMAYDSLLFVKDLYFDPEKHDDFKKLMKIADERNKEVKDILDRWIDFLDRLKKTGLKNLDMHNGNLGYDKEGKLKLLDL
jgi:hypothetical protein